MLNKINEGRVESDCGFTIQIKGLECLEYVDKEHSLQFEWNYDPKTNKTYVFITNESHLSKAEKARIAQNIKQAVELLKGNFEIILE